MIKKTLLTTLSIAIAITTLTLAQPPDYAVFPGDDQSRHERRQGDRLDRMIEYLELSDAQAAEWQTLAEQHAETVRSRMERAGALREEFGELADQPQPELELLGQIALDLHREMKAARSAREQLLVDLEEILTPEQAERFAALKAARELTGQGDRRGRRGGRHRPDSN